MDGVLTLVDEKPKDVTERIKTFEDAINELGREHPYVKSYTDYFANTNYLINTNHLANANYLAVHDKSFDCLNNTDILAYLKLRIVCAALNEGWEPKFTEDEWRYYPWFVLYTKTELEKMPDGDKKKLVIIDTGDYDTEYAGFAYSDSINVPSNTTAYFGSRLCLKSEKLAGYCGKQFISLWADYLLRRKGE